MVKELKKTDESQSKPNNRPHRRPMGKGRTPSANLAKMDVTDQFLQTSPAKPEAPKHQRKPKSQKANKTEVKNERTTPTKASNPPTPPRRDKPAPKKESTAQSRRTSATNASSQVRVKANPHAKLRIIPLGGLSEVGKNITAIECNDDSAVFFQTYV